MEVLELSAPLRKLLGEVADQLGKETKFIRRTRKLTGSGFAQALVFGWLAQARASLGQLAQTALLRNVPISPQGLGKRFTAQAATFLRRLLGEAAKTVVMDSEGVFPSLLDRFREVWIFDATVIGLPNALAATWPGTGGGDGKGNQAALKVEAGLELKSGQFKGPWLLAGRAHDAEGELMTTDWPADSLTIGDLGYFSLTRFAEIGAAGAYWLSRWRHDVQVHDEQGQWLDMPAWLDSLSQPTAARLVRLGAETHLPARLLACRAPAAVADERRRKLRATYQKTGRTPSQRSLKLCDWTLLVTNAPPEKLSLMEALALYGGRWRIELVFRLWKTNLRIDESVSEKPWRILCEIYAKLLIALIQHWIMLTACWRRKDRSMVKAFQTIAQHAAHLAANFDDPDQFDDALRTIARRLLHACRQDSRRKHPNTWKTFEQGRPTWYAEDAYKA